jgi:hypothetical protein
LQADDGHEVMVHETWIGEWIYSSPNKENGTASTAVRERRTRQRVHAAVA